MTAVAALLSVTAVSLVSLVGLFALGLSEPRARRLARLCVGFAVGALLGDAFIHLIPAAFAGRAAGTPLGASLAILGGMLLFFVLEKLLRHRHGLSPAADAPAAGRPAIAAMNVLGDAIHNFIDGVLIGAAWLVSPTLGVSTSIAVLLHELPQEFGDFGVLVDSGLSVGRAMVLNVGSASVAILGTVIALAAGSLAGDVVALVLVPVTAGAFVYLAAADLVPELQHERGLRALLEQTSLIAAGIAVMAALAALE